MVLCKVLASGVIKIGRGQGNVKARVLDNCKVLEVHKHDSRFGEERKTELVSKVINELGK